VGQADVVSRLRSREEMTEPIPSRPHPSKPGANAGEKLICVYCPRRLSSGDSLWDHVKRDHASKIQRHGAVGELEALKHEVIAASMGKERWVSPDLVVFLG
jgi:hypothetical protein